MHKFSVVHNSTERSIASTVKKQELSGQCVKNRKKLANYINNNNKFEVRVRDLSNDEEWNQQVFFHV